MLRRLIGFLFGVLIGGVLAASVVQAEPLHTAPGDLHNADPWIRFYSAKTILETEDQGHVHDEAVRTLWQLSEHPLHMLQRESTKLLAKHGIASPQAVSRLEVALHKGTLDLKGLEQLRTIGSEASIEALGHALGHDDPEYRKRAAELLGDLGPDAEPAVDMLVRAVEDPLIAPEVIAALGKIGGPRAVGTLISLLDRGTDEEKIAAAKALSTLPEALHLSQPSLRRLTESDCARCAEAAKASLRALGVLVFE